MVKLSYIASMSSAFGVMIRLVPAADSARYDSGVRYQPPWVMGIGDELDH
jgi:hypothetical protein